jgi:3-phenylpropionate/trans-cinnamate dioxygenase ferredoxin reductase subunit
LVERFVVIGAGQACAQAVTTLRAEGFAGSVAVVGEEPYPPYQRPPLSKAYLAGTFERERLFLKPQAFYTESHCELILDTAAVRIDREAHVVELSCSAMVSYEKLLLATGSRARRLAIEGANLPGIYYLRGIADVDALRANFGADKRLAVVGGGYIGLEVAAVARKLGLQVTVFEALDRVMARAVSAEMSSFYESVHRDAGVRIEVNTAVDRFEGNGRLEAVRADGEVFPADLALIGIGIVPNVDIAQRCGLACDDGIIVDDCARTADPDIFAAGDCTRHIGRDGALIRLESVQNAIDQAKHAALAMLGKPVPYREVPWFWSDQYDLKLQIAGLARPGDVLVRRGDPGSRKFAIFHQREGRVAAVEAVNAASEYIVGRRLIAEGTLVAPERLADTAVPMKSIA